MTRQEKRSIKAAEKELRVAISEEDRYMWSVFSDPIGLKQHKDRVKLAYANYRRLGGNKDI